MRLLLVDDDRGLRALIRATFESFDIEVLEAGNANEARASIEQTRPDAIVLDVSMPGETGDRLCRALKADPNLRSIGVVLLTGSEGGLRGAQEAGADAFLAKPFSPLELLGVVERLAGGVRAVPIRSTKSRDSDEQLMLYARDLRHLLELERSQRALLESAYRQTVSALAAALETKDTGTRAHSRRVQRYALDLAGACDPALVDDPSLEYGFLLHDVGKIGIPDAVLLKPGPLTRHERALMQKHTVMGEQMLSPVVFLHGEGLRTVRSHHERWDGSGYPDGLSGDDIPLGARVFAVADTLDAMTSNRPYRRAMAWRTATEEIRSEAGKQFDPGVVEVFCDREPQLLAIRRALVAA